MANITLLNMDCMTYMAGLPDKAFNLAICDPEYGLDIANRIGSIGQKKGQGKITSYKKKTWDKIPAGAEYFLELFRVSVNQIIWGANYFTPFIPIKKTWIVWDKGQPEGVTFSMHELAFTSFEGQAKIFRKTFASSCNKVANNNHAAAAYAKIHPTQKPIQLYKWLLKNYAKPEDRILDTHLGSGSSAIAAHQMGFDFVGTEIDADYYKASLKRYREAIRQLPLYSGSEC